MQETPPERPPFGPITNTLELHLGALIPPENAPRAIQVMKWAVEELARLSIDGEVTAWQFPLPAQTEVGLPPVMSQAEQAGRQQRTADLVQKFDLSDRELEIASLIAQGVSTNAELAKELHIGVETVKSHKRRLYKKTGATAHGDILGLFGIVPARGEQKEITP